MGDFLVFPFFSRPTSRCLDFQYGIFGHDSTVKIRGNEGILWMIDGLLDLMDFLPRRFLEKLRYNGFEFIPHLHLEIVGQILLRKFLRLFNPNIKWGFPPGKTKNRGGIGSPQVIDALLNLLRCNHGLPPCDSHYPNTRRKERLLFRSANNHRARQYLEVHVINTKYLFAYNSTNSTPSGS